MEYGVFSEASANWFFLKLAFGLTALGIVSTLIAVCSDQSSKKEHTNKRALLESRAPNSYNAIPVVMGCVAALSFIGAIVLLTLGLLAGHTGNCMNQKYADEGTYRVVSATLVYEWDFHGDDRPTTPKKFDLEVEGRGDNSSPSEWKILRCVTVPYDQIVENYTYAPHDLPTFKENTKTKVYTVHKGNYDDTARVDIDTPEFIIKQGGRWWKFSDEMR